MKIYDVSKVQRVMKAYDKNIKKTEKVNKSTFKEDKIEISDEARYIQTAMKAFKELPDVRDDKVKDIKKEISEGTYNPSAKDVVEKMLKDLGKK